MRRDRKMKLPNFYDDFGIVSDFENLYKAHRDCRKGVRWKNSAALFDLRALESIYRLKKELDDGIYRISKYYIFQINERGHKRTIKSTKYRDRLPQKSFHDNIVVKRVFPSLIYDNYASQKGKGTDRALERLKQALREAYALYGLNFDILIGDMKGYFDSIDQSMVEDMYKKDFNDPMILDFIHQLHETVPGGIGIPMGNQLSQGDALLAASPLDHFIKEDLGIKWYGRYMDDFWLIHLNRDHLKYCRDEIKVFAACLGLTLSQKKTKLSPATTGINFLGFRFYLTDTGKVVMRIKADNKNRHKQKLRKYKKKILEGNMTKEDAETGHLSWEAHASRGNTHSAKRKVRKYMQNLFKEVPDGKTIIDPPRRGESPGHRDHV